MAKETRYSIGELAREAKVTPRTVRFYVDEGLLLHPERLGRYATYPASDLNRLRLIAKLKRAFLPLSAIRERLQGLTNAQIEALAGEPAPSQFESDPQTFPAERSVERMAMAEQSATSKREENPSPNAYERVMIMEGAELHLRATAGNLTPERRNRLVSEVKDAIERAYEG